MKALNKTVNRQYTIGKKKNVYTKIRLQIASCRLLIANCLLPIAYCIMLLSCNSVNKNSEVLQSNEYYTCSMDPQVIENTPGNCPICHKKLIKVKNNNLKPGQIKLSEQQIKLAKYIVT